MISNQEKGDQLDIIFEKLRQNQTSKDIDSSLHKLLLDDCDGKLYKFMPFREYTIPTIRENTLYFSSPIKFNDPFDCKIGLDYHSLIEALYLKEFDNIDLFLGDFLALRSGKKTIEMIPIERLPVITRWANSKKLIDFLNSIDRSDISNEGINELLFNNIDIVCEIVNPLIEEMASKKRMPITASMVPGLLANMSTDGKKHLIESEMTYADYIKSLGIDDDADEIELTEKAHEKIHPDSRGAIIKGREIFTTIEKMLNESLYSFFKVCCLCTNFKNKLMWSHYADSHKGLCIEYDFAGGPINGNQPMPVYYSRIRPKFPWRAAIAPSPQEQSEATIHFMKALLTKDEAWSYENEWRILIQAKEGLDKIPAPPIKCIYLGALCSQNDEKAVNKVAEDLKIPVKRMVVDRGEYELHASEIACN